MPHLLLKLQHEKRLVEQVQSCNEASTCQHSSSVMIDHNCCWFLKQDHAHSSTLWFSPVMPADLFFWFLLHVMWMSHAEQQRVTDLWQIIGIVSEASTQEKCSGNEQRIISFFWVLPNLRVWSNHGGDMNLLSSAVGNLIELVQIFGWAQKVELCSMQFDKLQSGVKMHHVCHWSQRSRNTTSLSCLSEFVLDERDVLQTPRQSVHFNFGCFWHWFVFFNVFLNSFAQASCFHSNHVILSVCALCLFFTNLPLSIEGKCMCITIVFSLPSDIVVFPTWIKCGIPVFTRDQTFLCNTGKLQFVCLACLHICLSSSAIVADLFC